MNVYYDKDADLSVIKSKKVTIIGEIQRDEFGLNFIAREISKKNI